MTDKPTTPSITEQGQKFLDEMEKITPPNMSGYDLVRAMSTLLTTYTSGPREALEALMALTAAIETFYASNGECDCPKCRARRVH